MNFLRKTKHHLKLHVLYVFLLAGDYHYMILSFDVINYNSQILLSTRLKALLVGDCCFTSLSTIFLSYHNGGCLLHETQLNVDFECC